MILLDKEKLRSICENYYGDVYRFSLHFLRDSEKAADITQETFLLLIDKADFLSDENLKSWLLSTAYNKTKNLRKTAQNELQLFAGEEEPESSGTVIEDELVRENILRYSHEAISSLNEKEKQLYFLRYRDNLSCREISQMLGESENNVYVRIHRLREKVGAYIREKILI